MVNLDKLMEREAKNKDYRATYNVRPDVKARRKLYNQSRQEQMKVVTQFRKSELTREQCEARLQQLDKEYKTAIAKLQGSDTPKTTRATSNV